MCRYVHMCIHIYMSVCICVQRLRPNQIHQYVYIYIYIYIYIFGNRYKKHSYISKHTLSEKVLIGKRHVVFQKRKRLWQAFSAVNRTWSNQIVYTCHSCWFMFVIFIFVYIYINIYANDGTCVYIYINMWMYKYDCS